MEELIKIKTPDNHSIYGTLNYHQPKPSKLIIFIHGLTGNQNEHLFFNAAKFFPAKGIATFRFNLYDWRKTQRKFRDCTVALHGKDVTSVVRYFRKKFNKIFLVGHSLGGPSILLSDTSLADGIILWDPAHPQRLRKRDPTVYRYEKKIDAYIIHWNVDTIMGKKMYREWMNFPDCGKLISKVKKPIKIIVAGKGILVKTGKEYFKKANFPKAFSSIAKATHCFDEEGTEEELFKETWEWVKKY